MEFEKYQIMGSYHWDQTKKNLFNNSYNPLLEARYSIVLSLFPNTVNRICDLGCGDGYLSFLLGTNTNREIIGVDNNLLAISISKKKLSEYNRISSDFMVASITQLPYKKLSFDLVILADVIEHIHESDNVIEEIFRILTDTGVAIITTPHGGVDGKMDKYHVREYSDSELRSFLSQHFKDVEIYGTWPLYWMKLWKTSTFFRKVIQLLSILGYNPFLKHTSSNLSEYGQLVAVCRK